MLTPPLNRVPQLQDQTSVQGKTSLSVVRF